MNSEYKKPENQPKGWRKLLRFLINVVLFLASPFIALSYFIALPVVGFYQFTRAALQKKRASD